MTWNQDLGLALGLPQQEADSSELFFLSNLKDFFIIIFLKAPKW